jgi:hypothetical protein
LFFIGNLLQRLKGFSPQSKRSRIRTYHHASVE